MRNITDETIYLIYYFHYISPIRYSLSELSVLFEVSNQTVCNYLNEVKKKISKDSSLIAEITDKFHGLENIAKYRKDDLKQEIK